MKMDELKTMIAEMLKVPRDELSESASISRKFGIDSLAFLRLICEIERTYDVEIDERELDMLDNLAAAHKYINYLISKKA
jgi:acyl carrier protein